MGDLSWQEALSAGFLPQPGREKHINQAFLRVFRRRKHAAGDGPYYIDFQRNKTGSDQRDISRSSVEDLRLMLGLILSPDAYSK
jgi:hypothetical protein